MIKITSPVLCLAAAMLLFVRDNAFPKGEPIRHLVLFKYTPDASADKIQKVTEAFLSLKHKIPGIVSFEYGVDNSTYGMNQGFTHVYLMTFADDAAREIYLPHPEHKKFQSLLEESGVLEKAFIMDWVPHRKDGE